MHLKAFLTISRRKNQSAYHLRLLSFAAFFDELIENVLPLFYLYVMATVKEVILKEKKRDDGTWNLKIRIIHNRRIAYIATSHYIGAKQIRKDFSIKDPFIEDLISPVLANYRKKISSLGAGINSMTAKDVADFLKKEDTLSDVHFINFAEKYICELKLRLNKLNINSKAELKG